MDFNKDLVYQLIDAVLENLPYYNRNLLVVIIQTIFSHIHIQDNYIIQD